MVFYFGAKLPVKMRVVRQVNAVDMNICRRVEFICYLNGDERAAI